jgi:plastocyanin
MLRAMRILTLIFVVLATPLAAGCGGGDEGGMAEQPAAAQTIQISATDFQFDPRELTADPGEISFELTNDGQSPHALEVEGGGVEAKSDTIDPGASTTLTVSLEEGEYEIYCPVGDHKDRGMTGTLVVGGGGAGGGGTTTHEGETHTGETETGETETGQTETGQTDTNGGAGGY